jgi:hypothetical protein
LETQGKLAYYWEAFEKVLINLENNRKSSKNKQGFI